MSLARCGHGSRGLTVATVYCSPYTHTHTYTTYHFLAPDWPGTQLQGQPPIAAPCLPSAGIGNMNQHTWFICTHYEFSSGSEKTNDREWRKHMRKSNHVSLHCGPLPDLSSVHMPRPPPHSWRIYPGAPQIPCA